MREATSRKDGRLRYKCYSLRFLIVRKMVKALLRSESPIVTGKVSNGASCMLSLVVRTKVGKSLVSFLVEQVLNPLQAGELCLAIPAAAIPEGLRDDFDLSPARVTPSQVVGSSRTDCAQARVEAKVRAQRLPSLGGAARDHPGQVFNRELGRLRNVGHGVDFHAQRRVLSEPSRSVSWTALLAQSPADGR